MCDNLKKKMIDERFFFFENVKNVQIYEFLENFSWRCGQTVVPDRSILVRQKLAKNVKIQRQKLVKNAKMRKLK